MDVAVQQAQQAMQTAERNQDTDPRAQREAKIKYYRLAQGEEWMQQERERVLQEAKTFTSQWQTEQDSLQSQRQAQQRSVELVRAAEGGTMGLQEDVQQAVEELRKMVTRERDRRNVDTRLAQQAVSPEGSWAPPRWLITFLDFLIVGLLGQTCQLAYRLQSARNMVYAPPFLSGT